LSILLAEAKASLEAWAETIGVSIVDTASYKASDAAVTVTIKLDTTSEGCTDSTISISDLSGNSELRDKLSISIKGTSNTWAEGKVTIATKKAVGAGNTSNSTKTSCSS